MNFNTLIKHFESGYIFHFGIAYIIIFARYNDKGFYGEYFLIVEKPDGSFDHMAKRIQSELTSKELDNIEDFLTEFCISDIKSYIAKSAFENSHLIETERIGPTGQITINKMTKSSMYLYLINKDKSILEWVIETSKAPELKENIKFYMDFVVQISSLS